MSMDVYMKEVLRCLESLWGYFLNIISSSQMLMDEFLSSIKSWYNNITTDVEPTVLEAAYLAQHICNATAGDINKPSGESYGGWMLIDYYCNDESLVMGVYSKTINGDAGYAIVNKGSSTITSYINNFQQPFGLSDDMRDSIRKSIEYVNIYNDSDMTFVGHSKGGAEATANAVANNEDAILFNPATAALSSYGLDSGEYNGDMTAYIVKGEILHLCLGLVSKPIGEIEFIDSKEKNIVDKHYIRNVIKALKEGGYK